MPGNQNEVEVFEGTVVGGEDRMNLPDSPGSKFLSAGKYFLILLLLASQAFLAYTIVDRNYEKIYSFVNGAAAEKMAVYQMEELIVNPAGTNGQRYLVVEISLELEHMDHIELVEAHKQRIKHDMNVALASRTISELVRFEERETLRNELAGIVNQAIGVRSVRNLYYTKYVMQ